MIGPQAVLKALYSRLLPKPVEDEVSAERTVRCGRYGDLRVESTWTTDHLLADEGCYMVAQQPPPITNIQLGISATFSATAGFVVLGNGDTAGGKRIYPRWLRMAVQTIPSSGLDFRYAIVLDSKDRTPTTIRSGSGGSGQGTATTGAAFLAPVFCTSTEICPSPIGLPYFPCSTNSGAPPVLPAAGPNARTIVGNGYIRNSSPATKDQYVLQFGGGDMGGTFINAANIGKLVEYAPPVVIGPGQFLIVYLWSTSNSSTGPAFDDLALAWIER